MSSINLTLSSSDQHLQQLSQNRSIGTFKDPDSFLRSLHHYQLTSPALTSIAMYLSWITLLRILLVWFTFHPTTTSAIDLTCHKKLPGKEAPKYLSDAWPNFKEEDKKDFPAAVLRGVLRDQLQEAPMANFAYVFVISWPGNIVENKVNAGSHIGIIVAQFNNQGYNAAHLHHLGGPDDCGNRHDWEDFDQKKAFNACTY